MRSFLPLTVYCISLVSLPQLLALPAEERPGRNRSDLLNKLIDQGRNKASVSGSQSTITVLSSVTGLSPKWLPVFPHHQPSTGVKRGISSLVWARRYEVSQFQRRALRSRRHAHSGSRGHHYQHHGQLMRVGCILGTCQVQNLSHRLYQLIGQSGREDSSPINPRSPHSYG
uniref:Uncharacterized protein n=1 Tax=Mola mola TaxID=94237 RepID=A0A3Q4B5E7_MOLML